MDRILRISSARSRRRIIEEQHDEIVVEVESSLEKQRMDAVRTTTDHPRLTAASQTAHLPERKK